MGRNFFELCQECLRLLKYPMVTTLSELDTTEGNLIKQKMNDVLYEICLAEHGIWKFREKEKDLYLQSNVNKYALPNGYILFIRPDDTTNRVPLHLS